MKDRRLRLSYPSYSSREAYMTAINMIKRFINTCKRVWLEFGSDPFSFLSFFSFLPFLPFLPNLSIFFFYWLFLA